MCTPINTVILANDEYWKQEKFESWQNDGLHTGNQRCNQCYSPLNVPGLKSSNWEKHTWSLRSRKHKVMIEYVVPNYIFLVMLSK